jgi:lipopolysaccharide/colanic/teichoic acid biosynthesis glycosyltransferase
MIKRFLDIFGSMVALILFSPLLMIISIVVRWKIGSPVFFRQNRPGRNGELFKFIKFRTMLDLYAKDGSHLDDKHRITGLGQFLRKTSLDELPSFVNVLMGDMSLVGPRPLLVEYLPLYDSRQLHRHDLKPGITGWAQINGRNTISWRKKFELDLWYIENQSLKVDLKIIILTLLKVLAQEGINSQSNTTMSKFEGNK